MTPFLFLLLKLASQARLSAAQTSIDPDTVSPVIRDGWCSSQNSVCSTLCNGKTILNECILTLLTAQCQCDGTFEQPNFALYKGSLPYFVCEEYVKQCVAGNATNTQNQEQCRANKCPSLNPFLPTPSDTPEGTQGSSPSSSSASLPSSPAPSSPPSSSPSANGVTTGSQSQTSEATISSSTSAPGSPPSQATTTSAANKAVTGSSTITSSSTGSSVTTGKPDSSANPTPGGSKGLGTPAIVGIAVGVGIPVILISVFLAYRLGGMRKQPLVPGPNAAFGKEYGQWDGGNQAQGGGNDPGVGFGNEVGGIAGRGSVINRT